MHEANFELIEIPHVRQSGKNSADIRMVVDALDLCYTKAHVDTFVIVSGDSDFSPLVSKLRENAKRVIGVGVKQSTSDLLVANCDEFIFYDDLVREIRRAAAKRDERKAQPQSQQGRRPSDESNRKREEMESRKLQALEMVVETFDALVSERGDTGKIWASLLKDTLKRRRPDFSETYYGFRTFGNLLEEAQTRGLFEFGRDEKSGTYVYRSNVQAAEPLVALPEAEQLMPAPELAAPDADEAGAELPLEQAAAEAPADKPVREPRRRGGRGRKGREQAGEQVSEQAGEPQAQPAAAAPSADTAGSASGDSALATWPAPTPDLAEALPVELSPVDALADVAAAAAAANAASAVEAPAAAEPAPAKERRRAPRKPSARKAAAAAAEAAPAEAAVSTAAQDDAAVAADALAAVDTAAAEATDAPDAFDTGAEGDNPRKKQGRAAHKAPSRKPAARTRRPAKPKTPGEGA
jgi:hypothetical protein